MRTNKGSVSTAIIGILRQAEKPMTAAELRKSVDRRHLGGNTIYIALRRLLESGMVKNVKIPRVGKNGPRYEWVIE